MTTAAATVEAEAVAAVVCFGAIVSVCFSLPNAALASQFSQMRLALWSLIQVTLADMTIAVVTVEAVAVEVAAEDTVAAVVVSDHVCDSVCVAVKW